MTDATASALATSALATDQYELTMAASYFAQSMTAPATFDLFIRRLPEARRFLVAAGVDEALDYLADLHFTASDIDYLRGLGTFTEDFLDYLADFRFTGEVWAIPEGEVFFPGEPVMRVTAPMIEAQMVETALISIVGHQSAIASKAARIALASGDHEFDDFSARRAHGLEAGVKGARSAYLAGASATSNVLAGKTYGIPLSGTMAHSYVTAFGDERDAFRTFALDFPTSTVLLIDTYDTVEGARRAVQVAQELAPRGVKLRGVRIDSGDLGELARRVREVLDQGGLEDVSIIVSGDLDEYRIADLLAGGAPIDSFGVGTQMGVSADAPALSAVYKLAEYDGRPVLKLSTDKQSLPGRKQVWRREADGILVGDTIGLEDDAGPGNDTGFENNAAPDGRPMLQRVMVDGVRSGAAWTLADARERCARALASLPAELRLLESGAPPAPVETSPALDALVTQVTEGLERQ